MRKDPAKEFLEKKKQVLDNLESLEAALSLFPDSQEDTSDSFYEELESLMEKVESCQETAEFFSLVEIAKEIEHNMDVWFCQWGKTQMELSWPEEDL